MKKDEKLSILPWLKKSKATKRDGGRAPLYLRITIDGSEEEISVNRKVHPDYWNEVNKMDTEPGHFADETNAKIKTAKEVLELHFKVLQLQRDNVSALMLKNVYNGLPVDSPKYFSKSPREGQIKILEAADAFISEFEIMVEKKQRSAETLKQWRATRKKIAEFVVNKFKKEDVDLNLIQLDFAKEFHSYLTLYRNKTLGGAAAKKQLTNTKQILDFAESKKWLERNPIEKFRCSFKEKEVQPLEFVDVMSIYEKPMLVERLEEVRDAYIFQCFTGFAYQDIYNLSPDNVVQIGNEGERWLVKERGKTEVSEMVPILPIVDALIAKYRDNPYCRENNRLLPINSNQRYNAYLKEVAHICGVKRVLKTHLARHTFADIMLNICNVPLEDVSKMLGHKSIRTTMRYCRVRTIRISRNMKVAKMILFTKNGKFKKIAA